MKTNYLLLISLFVALFIAGCEKDDLEDDGTPKPGDGIFGEVSGTWEKNKTYVVTGHLEIPEGKSLTIEEGAKVVFSDSTLALEVIIRGSLYCYGTATNPVVFTVPEEWVKSSDYLYGRLWAGMVAARTSEAVVMENTIVEHGGQLTTEESPSVRAGLYKAKAGKHLPALYYGNVNGSLVVINSIFRHLSDDALYVEGGKTIIANNVIYAIGDPKEDAINLKSGVEADVAFNLLYSPNTAALKMGNDGEREPQLHAIVYNNTIINGGWRRPEIKGGSIWVEKSVFAELYNNMIVNCRYGIKRDPGNPEDHRSVFANTLYYGYTQEAVDQFQPSDEIVAGINDIIGTKPGENDPKFINYPLDTDMMNAAYDMNWDFHLEADSPALNKGKTDFTRHFADGIVVNGKTYKSPEPAGFIGAYGTK